MKKMQLVGVVMLVVVALVGLTGCDQAPCFRAVNVQKPVQDVTTGSLDTVVRATDLAVLSDGTPRVSYYFDSYPERLGGFVDFDVANKKATVHELKSSNAATRFLQALALNPSGTGIVGSFGVAASADVPAVWATDDPGCPLFVGQSQGAFYALNDWFWATGRDSNAIWWNPDDGLGALPLPGEGQGWGFCLTNESAPLFGGQYQPQGLASFAFLASLPDAASELEGLDAENAVLGCDEAGLFWVGAMKASGCNRKAAAWAWDDKLSEYRFFPIYEQGTCRLEEAFLLDATLYNDQLVAVGGPGRWPEQAGCSCAVLVIGNRAYNLNEFVECCGGEMPAASEARAVVVSPQRQRVWILCNSNVDGISQSFYIEMPLPWLGIKDPLAQPRDKSAAKALGLVQTITPTGVLAE